VLNTLRTDDYEWLSVFILVRFWENNCQFGLLTSKNYQTKKKYWHKIELILDDQKSDFLEKSDLIHG